MLLMMTKRRRTHLASVTGLPRPLRVGQLLLHAPRKVVVGRGQAAMAAVVLDAQDLGRVCKHVVVDKVGCPLRAGDGGH